MCSAVNTSEGQDAIQWDLDRLKPWAQEVQQIQMQTLAPGSWQLPLSMQAGEQKDRALPF